MSDRLFVIAIIACIPLVLPILFLASVISPRKD